MSLYSVKRLHSNILGELPIYQDVTDIVEQHSREEEQQVMYNNQPLFDWILGKEIKYFHHYPIVQEEEKPYENQSH